MAGSHFQFASALERAKKPIVPAPAPQGLNPALPDLRLAASCFHQGRTLLTQGKLDAAIEAMQRAAFIAPSCVQYHVELGRAFHQARRFREAAISYGRALEIWPESVEAMLAFGVTLHKQGRLDDAMNAYMQALRLNPNSGEAYTNLGTAFQDKGEHENAIQCQRRAVELRPNMASARNNLGVALLRACRQQEAIESLKHALRLQPNHSGAYFNLGCAYQELGRPELAEQHYRRAIELNPESQTMRFYMGTLQLQKGDFRNGWRGYELRWESRHQRHLRRSFAQPQWMGEGIAGQTILLHAEQGFGDTMQFVRYAPLLVQRGARVVLEVQPRLTRLLSQMPGMAQVLAQGEPLPEFQWHCPLASLPLAFGTEPETVPCPVPYLAPNALDVEAWAKRLAGDKLKVGIAWAGNPKHPAELARSIPLQKLARLMRVEGTQFYSLQKGAANAHIAALPDKAKLIDLDSAQGDFHDSAAIAANLDLVISIDTSVAHLAGALGRPLWLLLHEGPDWRWMLDRDDTPWYPTARLFRKKAGEDWDDVIARVRRELKRMTKARFARTETCTPGNAPR